MKSIGVHYLLGLVMCSIFIGSVFIILELYPGLGYTMILINIIGILILQIIYYYFTSIFKFFGTVVCLLLNNFLLLFEAQFLEGFVPREYKHGLYWTCAFFLFTFLWVSNKILIDKLFVRSRSFKSPLQR